MKQLFIQLNVAIGLLLAFSFHCMGADKYTLEFNLEKGKTYKQHSVWEMTMTMNAMGQDFKVNMLSETKIRYDVINKNNDVYDIQMSYQKFKVNMGAPTPIAIDTDSPDNSSDKSISDAIQPLMGIPIDIQLTKDGKVISVKGTENLAEKINAISNEQYRQMLGPQFSEKTVQTLLEQLSPYFPDKAVAINDSWDVVRDIYVNGIDIINKMKITLQQVKNNVATLRVTGTLTTPEGGAVMDVQGMEATVSMNGEHVGTVQIDMKTGWILRSEITQKSKQNIEIMGQTMQQYMDVKSNITAE